LILGLVVAGLLPVPPLAGAATEPVRIGLISSLTGPAAQLGRDVQNGFMMYIEEVGSQVAGRPIRVIVEDDEGTLPYGKFFGFFAAREKGFYKENGIEVDIIRGFSAADNFRRLDAGVCTFADAGLNVIVLARSKGAKVKGLGVWHDKGTDVLIARKDPGTSSSACIRRRTVR
jgi:hypothetical protein